MDPLKMRFSEISQPRRDLRQASLSSTRCEGSLSSNGQGFFRFYIATSCGRIVAKPTPDSINTIAEWFFAGFTRIAGTEINEKDRSEVYKVSTPPYRRGGFNLTVGSGVRVTLTAEGLVANIKKPKYNFTVTTLTQVLVTLWN